MFQDNWSKLNRQQLGRYGEYYTKLSFTKEGFDVFTAEVDDKGIDFVIRKNDKEYYDIQVKSVRNLNYVFVRKEVFSPRKNLLLILLLFKNGNEPIVLLIPSLDWKNKTHSFLNDRDYIGKKSKPEYGVTITPRNLEKIRLLYSFEGQVRKL